MEHVKGQPFRFHHGWVPVFPEIGKNDLSTPDARRSREVSPRAFQRLAARGAAEYQKMKRSTSPHVLSGRTDLVDAAFKSTRSEWGGATIDSHTGKALSGNEDAYALTVREPGMKSISIPAGASRAEFGAAYDKALSRYGEILNRPDHFLGVFHDADKGTIDFDPSLVTTKKSHVETIGAYTGAVGGAYHFKSGDGFWPPHVKVKSDQGWTGAKAKVRESNKVIRNPLYPETVGKDLGEARRREREIQKAEGGARALIGGQPKVIAKTASTKTPSVAAALKTDTVSLNPFYPELVGLGLRESRKRERAIRKAEGGRRELRKGKLVIRKSDGTVIPVKVSA